MQAAGAGLMRRPVWVKGWHPIWLPARACSQWWWQPASGSSSMRAPGCLPCSARRHTGSQRRQPEPAAIDSLCVGSSLTQHSWPNSDPLSTTNCSSRASGRPSPAHVPLCSPIKNTKGPDVHTLLVVPLAVHRVLIHGPLAAHAGPAGHHLAIGPAAVQSGTAHMEPSTHKAFIPFAEHFEIYAWQLRAQNTDNQRNVQGGDGSAYDTGWRRRRPRRGVLSAVGRPPGNDRLGCLGRRGRQETLKAR